MAYQKHPPAGHHLRIEFLKAHPELWKQLPIVKNPEGAGRDPRPVFEAWLDWKKKYNGPIVKAMKASGVVAPSTSARDINIPGLLEEIRWGIISNASSETKTT